MENTLLNPLLSLIFLLSVSSFVYIISKKIHFPYTVALVLVWLWLIPIIDIWYLSFIREFKLTPDLLFYIFLPILIFESAYNINYKDILKSGFSIFSLSVIWLVLSVLVISTGMYYIFPLFGFHIPYLVCLLYGSLISATDTVAVLTMFKSIWAPKRLVTMFEWESLFNDGTSLALFLVILWIISEWHELNGTAFWEWIAVFLSMFIGWILFWFLTWYIFSRIIGRIKNNEAVEITLTLILAHLTFILAHVIGEHLIINGFTFHISWVIATTVAAIVMGNYGRYKITPKITEFMEKFWWFMAFIANSLVFILLGLIVYDIKIDFFHGFIYLLIITFILWSVGRAVSVFLPIWVLNFFKIESKIPFTWQYVLAWWSPRWAISFMMILMIPDNLTLPYWTLPFSIKDFLTLITISTIMLTLFIKVPTIWILIKKLKLNKLTPMEKIEQEQSKIIMYLENTKRIEWAFHRWVITIWEFEELSIRFEKHIADSKEIIKKLVEDRPDILKRVISISALWIQKKYLIELLTYNEIDEKNFKILLVRIQDKMRKLESGKMRIIDLVDDYQENLFEKIALSFIKQKKSDIYIRKRTTRIYIWKSINELKEMRKIDFWFDIWVYDEIIWIFETEYKKLRKYNSEVNKDFIKLENKLFEKSIIKTSEYTISELKKKWIMTDKLYNIFMEKLEEKIYK